MKKILKIAKIELSILFYSPIAWLVLIIFIIQCGSTIIELLDARESSQQLGNELKALTTDVFGGRFGFFTAIKNKLYLYIPLLTMGLMSRELHSGSIKLLYSSPVTVKQIILGKFAAIAFYSFLLVVVLFGVLIISNIAIESLDIKYVLGGILGLYLLMLAYAAIGLFMSSITSYQIIAAISTLAILAALSFIGTIGQSIDFVRDITYWISIDGRANNFMNGLISSADTLYFLLVIGLFLTLSIMRLNSGRKIRATGVKIMSYSIVVTVVLMIGYISSLPTFKKYYDTTRFKTRTLTKESQELLKQIDKPVTITTYSNIINSFGHLGAPKFRIFDLKQFDQYTRFLPEIKFKYVPYYDYTLNSLDNADKNIEERGLQYATAHGYDFQNVLAPDEIKKIIDLTNEKNIFLKVVEYDGKETILRMFYDQIGYPQEAEVSAALKNLLTKPAVIGILNSNDERSIDKVGDKHYIKLLKDLNTRSSLVNQGFEVNNISLNNDSAIPQDLSVLIIADPFNPYTSIQLLKIKNYINNGGNILILGEPNKQHLLEPILKGIGIKFESGLLLQESKDFPLDLIQSHVSREAASLEISLNQKDIISLSGAMAISSIDTLGFKSIPILKTDKKVVWNKLGAINLDSDTIKFNPTIDHKIEVTIANALTRKINKKNQKIMVFGDADFISNKGLSINNLRTENFKFALEVFKWFSDGEYPIAAVRPEPIDNKIEISREKIVLLKIIFMVVIPFIIGVYGALLLFRRKRN
jgi:ABC-2 type transport system permease protein